MSHGAQRFRKSEVVRAIKAARSAGIEITRLELTKDGVVMTLGKPSDASSDGVNPWDEVLADAQN